MSRRINQKCLKCSQLPIETAQQLHGEKGDRCWDDLRCHKRRSHYRHRGERNTKRAVARRQQADTTQPETIASPLIAAMPVNPILIIYSEKPYRRRKPITIHALAAELWVGTEKKASIEPFHCLGLTEEQTSHLIKQMLQTFSEHYGDGKPLTQYADFIHRYPNQCPIRPCPQNL